MGRVKGRKAFSPTVAGILKPAAGIALAVVAYYFLQGFAVEIPRIDVEDELALREALFGEGRGGNYVVLCSTPPTDPAKKSPPLSSVFLDAQHEYGQSSHATFVLMDCGHILPSSGRTVADRFQIDLKKRPAIFVSGKVGPPRQVPQKHLKTGTMLAKLLRSMLEPHAAKIANTKDLRAKCLSKPLCGVLLKGGKPEPYVRDAVSNLLTSFPDVQFASVDATVLLMANLEEYLPEVGAGQHRFVLFKKVSGGMGAGGGGGEGEGEGDDEDEDGGGDKTEKKKKKKEARLITSVVPLEEGISHGSISRLIKQAKSGRADATKLALLPALKTRTKKLEADLAKKRERIRGQKDRARAKKKADEAPPGMFAENDGSREGRRAERERRRQEHLKANNVKPKTPEEIAEMERKRRERMNEEAKAWNIEGEDVDEDMDGGEDREDDEEGEEEYLDDGEEWADLDDEDVLDLD